MLEFTNFGHMNRSTMRFESSDKVLSLTPWPENIMAVLSKWLCFKKA